MRYSLLIAATLTLGWARPSGEARSAGSRELGLRPDRTSGKVWLHIQRDHSGQGRVSRGIEGRELPTQSNLDP